MLNADRKDYERICTEYGVGDLNSILKKLEEKRKERMQSKSKVWQQQAMVNLSLESVIFTENICHVHADVPSKYLPNHSETD